jgi:hypothetical protein
VITQWKEYLQEALSGDIGEEAEDYPKGMNTNVESEVSSPTLEEAQMAVKSLNNKDPCNGWNTC